MRVDAVTDLSRLTLLPSFKLPRFVRRSVSGATPNLKDVESKDVMVRQVPFMHIESPRAASVRMEAQSETVREVPLPPDWEGSSCWRAVTAEMGGQRRVEGRRMVRAYCLLFLLSL